MGESAEELWDYLAREVFQGLEAAKSHSIKVGDLRHGDFFRYSGGPGITIFGQILEHTGYEEDDDSIADGRRRGFVYGKCFSVFCPDGEFGDVHITDVREKIGLAAFEQARDQNWRLLRDISGV